MMLFLRFEIDGSLYGLASEDIVEIVPKVPLRPIPSAPPSIPGCFKYRGSIIPVVDISKMAGSAQSTSALSSRIAVVRYGAGRLLGVLLESATETMRIDEKSLESPCVKTDDARYLGRIGAEDGKIVQLIETGKLLDDSVKSLLFPEKEEASP